MHILLTSLKHKEKQMDKLLFETVHKIIWNTL